MIDLTGTKFNRLTAMWPVGRNDRKLAVWLFLCDCGQFHVACGVSVTKGNTKSCGCWSREVSGARFLRHGHTRNGKLSPAFRSWAAMMQRCNDPKQINWAQYGGRGINICERWHKFENFLADMGPRPPGMTLDRKDSDGNYELSNCRWATRAEQARNQRRIKITADHARHIRLLAPQLRYSVIAETFGVSLQTVERIARRETWTDC